MYQRTFVLFAVCVTAWLSGCSREDMPKSIPMQNVQPYLLFPSDDTWLRRFLAIGDRKIDIYISSENDRSSATEYVRDNAAGYRDVDVRIVVTNDWVTHTGQVKNGRKVIRYSASGDYHWLLLPDPRTLIPPSTPPPRLKSERI